MELKQVQFIALCSLIFLAKVYTFVPQSYTEIHVLQIKDEKYRKVPYNRIPPVYIPAEYAVQMCSKIQSVVESTNYFARIIPWENFGDKENFPIGVVIEIYKSKENACHNVFFILLYPKGFYKASFDNGPPQNPPQEISQVFPQNFSQQNFPQNPVAGLIGFNDKISFLCHPVSYRFSIPVLKIQGELCKNGY